MKKNVTKYFRFEHRNEKHISLKLFFGRMFRYFALSLFLIISALGIGIIGYHLLENLSFTDSFLNASMILGGMGPVSELKTEAGEIFAGLYALFSGLIFLVVVGLIIAPIFHHLLHCFQFEEE